MIMPSKMVCLLAGIFPLASNGCIVISTFGWSGPAVWTSSTTETITFDAANLKALEVRTHNGAISFEGQPAGTGEAFVNVTKKAGGLTQADAQEALAAIDVFVEPAGGSSQRIGWKWKGARHATWRAQVSFDIQAPGSIRFNGETHNGSVEIRGVAGDVRVVTHNGAADIESTGGKLYAETHNGKIAATYVGKDVTLITHNGEVVADLTGSAAIVGRITTHNGRVEVVVGEKTSAILKCRADNGKITCNVPLNDSEISRGRLTGTIGTGEGHLDITTHNGSVRIKKAG